MDRQNQIFDQILTKHKNDEVTDKDFSGVYKLRFYYNVWISLKLNLDEKG